MVLDAVETRREADPSFDVLEVICVMLLDGGVLTGALVVVLVLFDHVLEVHVGRSPLFLEVAGVVRKLRGVFCVLVQEVVAQILHADVLFVVLVSHGLGDLDHFGEVEHSNIGFAAFLLNRYEVHLLI